MMLNFKPHWIVWIFLTITIFRLLIHKLYIISSQSNNKFADLYSKEHEIAKRRLGNTIWDLYYYLSDQSTKHKGNKDLQYSSEFLNFTKYALDNTISLMLQFKNFATKIDNASEWHKSKLKEISNMIFDRLYKLQHPKSCANPSVKFLICRRDLNNCGFGCMLRRLGYCLRVAAISNRVMIVYKENGDWNYPLKSTDGFLEPISSCTYRQVVKPNSFVVNWTGPDQPDRLTILYDKVKNNQTGKMPLAFPAQIADELLKHHPNPPIFFDAHFNFYITKYNKFIRDMIDDAILRLNLNSNDSPIVGIHIRRTDKVKYEALAHPIEKYFEWTELWFKLRERNTNLNNNNNINNGSNNINLKRRVYLVSDDPKVLKEAKIKFPHYEILSNNGAAKIAGLDSRYSLESVYAFITEIEILAKCPYVVCTFTSNVCHYVYGRKQVEKGDAHDEVRSLDTDYITHYSQYAKRLVAVEDHKANSDKELDFKKGDVIGVAKCEGNLFNGFSTGYIRKSEAYVNNTHLYDRIKDRWAQRRFVPGEGLYPSYKAEEKWRIVDMPLFEP